jgi:hypothetical protein
MDYPVIDVVSKLVKFIDPIEVPAYRMRQIYQQRKAIKTVLKPTLGPYDKIYIKSIHPY